MNITSYNNDQYNSNKIIEIIVLQIKITVRGQKDYNSNKKSL